MKGISMAGGKWKAGALALAAVGFSGAAPSVPTPDGHQGATPAAAAKMVLATSKELGGADRFLSYLSTDKPIYRANEKVYARAVVLNAATRVALGNDAGAVAEIQILGPRGETVATGSS